MYTTAYIRSDIISCTRTIIVEIMDDMISRYEALCNNILSLQQLASIVGCAVRRIGDLLLSSNKYNQWQYNTNDSGTLILVLWQSSLDCIWIEWIL